MNKLIISVLGLAALGFVSCDDESYDDWTKTSEKETYSQETVIDLGLKATPSFTTVNLAEAEEGATYSINLDYSLPANANVSHNIAIAKEEKIEAATSFYAEKDNLFAVDGTKITFTAEQLQTMVTNAFGKAPEARDFYVVDKMVYSIDNMVFAAYVITAKITVTPTAPVIEEKYYFIGASNDWKFENCTEAFMFKRSDESVSVYDNPIFTVKVPAPTTTDEKTGETSRVDNWFKIAPVSAVTDKNWDALLGCEKDGSTDLTGALYVNGKAMNMPATDGALFYEITINMMEYTYSVKPLAFEDYIYIPGNAQGWKPATAPALKHEGDGVYKGFAVMDGEFKFTRERAWAGEYNAGDFKTVSEGFDVSAGAGKNIKYTGERAVYHLTVDVANGTIDATKIEYMGVTGDFAGWKEGSQMTWNDDELCFELKNAGVTDAGWKFRANGLTDPDWKINLGGDLTDLSYGGGNISTVGSTIKLFICRTNSDKYYATVE